MAKRSLWPACGILANNSQFLTHKHTHTHKHRHTADAAYPAGRDFKGDYGPVTAKFQPNPGFSVCWATFSWALDVLVLETMGTWELG